MFSEYAAYRAFRHDPFVERYRDFPQDLADERWAAMLQRLGEALPTTSIDAAALVVRGCELDCGVAAWTAVTPKSIGNILTNLWVVEPPFRPRLRGEAVEAMRAAWTRLARTLGVDPYEIREGLPADERPPWWALPEDALVGLTPPDKAMDLATRLSATGLVTRVAAMARNNGYPRDAADLVSLATFLRQAAKQECWVLARQAPT